ACPAGRQHFPHSLDAMYEGKTYYDSSRVMFSKSILFASIAVFALTPMAAEAAGMQAAPAPSPYDGFVSLAVGGEGVTDSFSGNATGISLTGAASVEAAFSNMLGFQGDLVL